jgi:UDP-N-acetylmuramate--alanine ligase
MFKNKKIYIAGIGGIGISALTRHYICEGAIILGEDDSFGEVTKSLMEEGVQIKTPLLGELLDESIDFVVYTVALGQDHPVLQKAKSLNIEIMTYPQALAKVMSQKKVIAICGTHGKTTTTAMTFYALKSAGVSVSIILGSFINYNGKLTNYIKGESDWVVIEACEYKRSFLNYTPNIILLTNIDNDHLDYFKDTSEIKLAFQEFVNSLQGEKILISHSEYLNLLEKKDKDFNFFETNLPQVENTLNLQVPGKHNRLNASLVYKLGEVLNLESQKVLQGLKDFPGTWRRQEYKGDFSGMYMYDDYAHHPAEIKATLQAFKEKYPNKKLLICFQPHLFSRTKLLFTDFVQELSVADEILLLPIYPAREVFDDTISSFMLKEELQKLKLKNSKYFSVSVFENILEIAEFIKQIKTPKDFVFINLGASDSYALFDLL